MVLRVAHFSDWHAKILKRQLPEADLYVCTGDIIDNFMKPGLWPQEAYQREWISHARQSWTGIFPSHAPLLIVRGNHDFVDLKPLFDVGQREIVEFGDEPSTWEYRGIKFGGFRGVTEINGCWADECTERVLGIKCEVLGPVDVLVTHTPPRGVLDLTRDGDRIGSKKVFEYAMDHVERAHLFGHVHESRHMVRRGKVLFSNAACTVNVVEL